MGFLDDIFETIIEIISPITDIIDSVVDTVFDVVDIVMEPVANLLGFDGDTMDENDVSLFEVHNQPLFENDSDKKPSAEVIYNAIINNRDIMGDLLYAISFQSGKQNVKKFVDFINDDNYFEDFPTLKGNILVIDRDEIDSILSSSSEYNTPVTIDNARLGSLLANTWIRYWLQENKNYNNTTNRISGLETVGNDEFGQGGTTLSISRNVLTSQSIYYSNNNNYQIKTNLPLYGTHQFFNQSLPNPGIHYSLTINEGLAVQSEDHSIDSSGTTHTITITGVDSTSRIESTYYVPSKPTGLHYIVNFHKDNDPSTDMLWVYKVDSGGYSSLDDPAETFGDSGSSALNILPAIPLRLNNTNFNSPVTSKTTQIRSLVDKVGLDADDLIDSVMTDVAAANISNYQNKVDHVYLNFGVRFWDTAQTSMNYCFKFIARLYAAQAITESDYNNSPSDDRSYNTILVTASDYKYAFKFGYITYTNYTLNQINSDSTLNAIYRSDQSKFDSYNNIIQTYYTSSGKATYNIGYSVSNTTDVAAFLAGTLTQNSGYTSEAANWMQPTQRIAYTGTILNHDDSSDTGGYLKPDIAYEKTNSTTLRKINKISEATSVGQQFKFYQCLSTGLNEYKIVAPKTMLRVVDAQTDKFKMVTFNVSSPTGLMMPFSHEVVKNLPNDEITNIFIASAHISLYVADVQVIDLPFWVKLLKIVQVVLFIMAIMSGQFATAEALKAMIRKIVIQVVVKKIVVSIAKEISPELAFAVGVVLAYRADGGDIRDIDFTQFKDVVELLGTATDILNQVFEQVLDDLTEALTEEEKDINNRKDDAFNALKDAEAALNTNSLVKSYRANLLPMMANEYYDYFSNYQTLAYEDFEYDNKFDAIYERNDMRV